MGLQRVRIHNTTPRDSGYDRIRSHEGAIHIPSLRSEPMTANKQQALKGGLSTACLETNLCADHHAFSESWSLARPQCRDRACCSRLTKTVGGSEACDAAGLPVDAQSTARPGQLPKRE